LDERKTTIIAVGLQKTRAILDVFEHDFNNDDYDFDALLELDSVEEVVAALNGSLKSSVPAQVFRNVFHDDEWAELEASDVAIAVADDAALRVLRLSRQRALLWETRKVAIDLTVRGAEQAGEQSGLVNECIQVMTGVLDVIGMNARGTVRRVQQVAAPSPPRAPAPRQRQRQVKVVVKQKAKRVVAVVKKKQKLVEEEEVEEDEDDEEQEDEEEEQDKSDEQDEVAKRARHDPEEEEKEEAVKKAKHDSNEEEEEEGRREEEEGFRCRCFAGSIEGPSRNCDEDAVRTRQGRWFGAEGDQSYFA
jgi:outer membrane biosynthesis protein TonB